MPQLNPAPWFLIFLLTWLTLLLLSMKILNNKPKPSTPKYSKQLINMYWTWPWP
uniref:ATP synthase complex subunit 8 n=1 Tax=Takydromus sylvaticus TaxID=363227 RepID=S4SS35_9SAUR|nr:ATP synthase F0 subunit 8 [Takydromus sylvaticus]AFP97620.1 ATP synthase F0 subunit 8 [Takydromus sylvaticus]UXG18840.1 ATP synthase F0 subunit 8 [Takydromus sylvaticus]